MDLTEATILCINRFFDELFEAFLGRREARSMIPSVDFEGYIGTITGNILEL